MTNKRLRIVLDEEEDDYDDYDDDYDVDEYNDEVNDYIKIHGCNPSPNFKSYLKDFYKRRKTYEVSYIN